MKEGTLGLPFNVAALRASRSWCGDNVDGKKKGMKKQNIRLTGKVVVCSQSGVCNPGGCRSPGAPNPTLYVMAMAFTLTDSF
jgi:hypothetical protein